VAGRVRGEDGEHRRHVALAEGREEPCDDRAPAVEVVLIVGGADPGSATGSAGELPGRLGGPFEDRRNLVEGDREDVVQDERDPLGRGEAVEDHGDGPADRVGDHRVGRGVVRTGVVEVGLVEDRLGPGVTRPQPIQADPRGDRGQPAAEVVDLGGVDAP
jgi:hypothetical protein